MERKAVTLQQMEEALRDYARWTQEKIRGTERKSPALNLLDNSNFTNPVNQRGETAYTANGYTVDRWLSNYGTLTLKSGYVNWRSDRRETNKRLMQKGGKKFEAGKTYTLAMLARVNEINGWASLRLSNNYAGISGATEYIKNTTGFEWIVLSHTLAEDVDVPSFDILVSATADDYLDIDIKAAAIYEGEYTVEMLPEYKPKGYNTELAICSQYNPNTGEFKGAYSMDLLWENASPLSTFTAQNISVDTSKYDGIEVMYYVWATTATSRTIYKPSYGQSEHLIYATERLLNIGYSKIGARRATITNSTVSFEDCIDDTGATQNDCMRPIAIYGIRGVG